ncbi:MAG: DMT family transporter [Alphaproteobacteria bacterium]|jgi:uncharacterized membrane protein|nr:DMT family transporter [Rhodospirillaceae bacterium]MBT6510965.1 DMT family transporter [Rhodospirillaceae bacterium]MBT7612593.1 DMT family transporter [Rhodospirillaceae bacterium]MDG2482991.1 DMT family transporter [Alphaproteobacteria bacterium]
MTAPNTGTPADLRIGAAREYVRAPDDGTPGDGPPGGWHPHVLGIALVVLGVALVNTSDAVGKWVIEELPICQLLLFQACGLMVMAPVVARQANPFVLIATPDPWWQIARSACQLVGGLTFFTGLRVLQFADVVAILFIGPLIVTALAHVFLGERVGPRRWAACGVGLIGGLVIVRPGTDVMGGPRSGLCSRSAQARSTSSSRGISHRATGPET